MKSKLQIIPTRADAPSIFIFKDALLRSSTPSEKFVGVRRGEAAPPFIPQDTIPRYGNLRRNWRSTRQNLWLDPRTATANYLDRDTDLPTGEATWKNFSTKNLPPRLPSKFWHSIIFQKPPRISIRNCFLRRITKLSRLISIFYRSHCKKRKREKKEIRTCTFLRWQEALWRSWSLLLHVNARCAIFRASRKRGNVSSAMLRRSYGCRTACKLVIRHGNRARDARASALPKIRSRESCCNEKQNFEMVNCFEIVRKTSFQLIVRQMNKSSACNFDCEGGIYNLRIRF